MASDTEDAIRDYKTLLGALIDRRPSGTRQRLADALGKNRSFVTQITSASYATPLPARHLATIFSVCHMGSTEQQQFLDAYNKAHPGRLKRAGHGKRLRHLSILAPDFGDEEQNRQFDQAITEFAHRMAAIASRKDD